VSVPLTPGQHRLWLLSRLDGGAVEYHIPLAWRIRGPLDAAALAAALVDVVDRHDALRTRIPAPDGEPVQEVVAGWRLPVDVRDLTPHEARERVTALTNEPFDLAAAPPVRAAVYRLGPDEHVLCLALHHVVVDAWSLDILFREVAAGYAARRTGRAAELPPLPLGFLDYAATVDGSAREESLRYWTAQLAGLRPLEWCTDRPRPAARSSRGAFTGFPLGPTAADDLRTLRRVGRTTPFMTLLAVHFALLGLHTGQDDIAVGSPLSARDRSDLEPVVGFFLTTLVLRGDLSGDPSFRELLTRVKATTVAAYEHPDVPLEELTTRLGVARDPARTPLFDTMLIVHAGEQARLELPDVRCEYFDPGHQEVKFDLTVEVFAGGPAPEVVVNHRADLFEETTIARLAGRFAALLRHAAAAPDAPLSQLYRRVARDEERPTPCAGDDPGPGVLELLAARVAADPAAVAIRAGSVELTYAELDERTARLAGALRGAGTLVAVALEPGADLIVALLAVLRAGTAYLPLDPEHPRARLEHVLTDSGASVVVTTSALAPGLPLEGRRVLCVDEPLPAPAALQPGCASAYAIYTSGSTGRPKAVSVPHSALASRVRWMVQVYGLRPGDRVLQFASASFDTFGEEVYPALAAGATVVVPDTARAELPDFLASPAGQQITVLDLPTAYWHELVSDPAAIAWPAGLRLLILGGEQVRADALHRWFAAFGDRVEVWNTYGPTEATIIATAARLTAADADRRPPIGHPLGGTCVHVRASDGGPVPAGVPGELFIGGVGLALGYLGRPELTASRFPDLDGVRHYRTGDRVRERPDGALEFLGRFDDQLKVRGHRIEPAEVEAALVAHPRVRHAIVTVDVAGRLVAHLVPAPGAAVPTPRELRTHLTELLPAAQHPEAYGVLAALPLTPTGKVDRAGLPPVERAAPATATRPPETDAERLVAAVWVDVLGTDAFGVDDDFFDLGGHSLLITRVAARIRAAAGVELPLRTLFLRRTAAELAEAVEDAVLDELEALDEDEAERLLAES
jgi:amino acid adenylation domain-containing protein